MHIIMVEIPITFGFVLVGGEFSRVTSLQGPSSCAARTGRQIKFFPGRSLLHDDGRRHGGRGLTSGFGSQSLCCLKTIVASPGTTDELGM
jgi:hypothetical protein